MAKKVTVRVPATSANCGPGFDSLGLACSYYNYFTFELLEEGLELEVVGEGEDFLLPTEDNLVYQAFFKLWNQANMPATGLKVKMVNRIPLSRGLGSSSSAIVAGLVAANYLAGKPYKQDALLEMATDIEGHPDNVAPAIYGGFTISYMQDGRAVSVNIKPKLKFQLVALIPELPLSTSEARQVLPQQVSMEDAIFNVSGVALLIAALTKGDGALLARALEDRLHQPYRLPLIPGALEAIRAAKDEGAYNAIISGAGSTLMAYVPMDVDSDKVGQAMEKALEIVGQNSSYQVLEIDYKGAKIQ